MTIVVVGECRKENVFELWDADGASETEFELIVAKALICIYPDYFCFPFGGTFKFEQNVSRPDIALVAKDLSHWFVIEVELVSHSLDGHIMPQIRTFRYGDPQPDCISVISTELGLARAQVETLILTVPRFVAVIVNKRADEWQRVLRSHGVQFLTVSAFSSTSGVQAFEVDGRLVAQQEHLGFGYYIATDKALRFHKSVRLPDGEIVIDDFSGAGSTWIVRRDGDSAWVAKNRGTPDIASGSLVQLVRIDGGRFSIRPSPGAEEGES
jgi:hypothetical protein